MGDFIAELIKRFGPWVILVLLLLMALVWFVAHVTTQPGKKVSIFWGMVEYTKSSELERKPKSEVKSKIEAESTQESEVERPKVEERKVSEVLDVGEAAPKEVVRSVESEKPKLFGSIISPPSGSRVARWFRVKGTVEGEYRHLWLLVRIGQLHWPKEPELRPTSNQWVGEVNEGGWPPEGRFEVLLVDVSNEVNAMFQKWLKSGHRSGNYPGIPNDDLGDVKILDSKEYQLITE